MQSTLLNPPRRRNMKVGELARRTGVSVRTLHYYDEIGLLSPSQHTPSGHRIYTDGDIARLQQIVSLRQLGLSLEEIANCLSRPAFSLRGVIEIQVARLGEQIETVRKLYERLRYLLWRLQTSGQVSIEELIDTMEVMKNMETRFNPNFTPEEMEEIRERGRTLGDEHIREVEAEWPQLIEQVRAEMEKGTDPSDPKVQALAKRWMELVKEFTGGNPEIERKLGDAYQQDPSAGGRLDPRMLEYMDYINKAMASGK